jgi:glutamine amidotransferase
MTSTFALFPTHPELVRCQLARLEGQIDLGTPGRFDEVGLGSFAEEEVLLRRLSRSPIPPKLSELFSDGGTEALIVQARASSPSRAVEAETQPLRFRHWLFALEGSVPEFPRLRPALEASLPEYLRRHVRIETEGEAAFALFLEGLRELGRTDDRSLEAERAAQLAGRAARRLSRLSAEAGASRTASVSLVATNARTLVAARLGSEPLFYTLLEGTDVCAPCGVTAESPELRPLVRAHRRCRSVAVATHAQGGRWIEIAPGQVLSVNDRAEVKVEAF